jgi:hypothetical protein
LLADVLERVLDKGMMIAGGPVAPAAGHLNGAAPGATGQGLCLYAITHGREWQRAEFPELHSGISPELVTQGGLGVVAAEVDLVSLRELSTVPAGNGLPATLVREHDTVVRAVFDCEAVLPLRFGTVVADAPAARQLLADRYDELTTWLARVAGHREWGLRVEYESPAGVDLVARQKRLRFVQSLHVELSKFATSAINRDRPRALLDAAYLVRQGNEDEFRAAAAWLSDEVQQFGAIVHATGPWPPYSFMHI